MRYLIVAASALWLTAVGQPVRAEVVQLKPSDEWTLDRYAESCRVVRHFGDGDRTARLQIQSFGPGANYMVLVKSEYLPRKRSKSTRISYGFRPDSELMQNIPAIAGISGGVPAFQFLATFDTAAEIERRAEAASGNAPPARRGHFDPEREASIRDFLIDVDGRDSLILETGSMAEPAAMLRRCSDELVAGWGFDVEQQSSLSRPPVMTNGDGLWRYLKYPRNWVLNGNGAFVLARLSVDEQGVVTDCVVQSPAPGGEYEQVLCDFLEYRAEFDPALDSNGVPLASFYLTAISFFLS